MKNYQFYHIYPLGMLNKLEEKKGDLTLSYLLNFIDHLKEMNINGFCLGPVFESKYHGYDTIDYYKVDSRLGTNEELKNLINECHKNDIDVIFDCVFNHVSREFFAFEDCLINKENSIYKDWFHINFECNNHRNDGFSYDTWAGHDELVKFNLYNPEVKQYLFDVMTMWIDYFDIDGVRLDAANVMDRGFQRELGNLCRSKKTNFYMVGETVGGDYQGLMEEASLDSVTNYECYKGLYSSLNDQNYFEINYALNRLFGQDGLIKGQGLYNFVDNHDVNRVASSLNNEKNLFPLYMMLYTMKGSIAIYYKSEFGEKGERTNESDLMLRRPFTYEECMDNKEHPLFKIIKKLSLIRRQYPVLCHGYYEGVFIENKFIGYRRYDEETSIFVLLNCDTEIYKLNGDKVNCLINKYNLKGIDILNDEKILSSSQVSDALSIAPSWGRIII